MKTDETLYELYWQGEEKAAESECGTCLMC